MATRPGGGAASARKIALAAARIFQTALNDTNLPTGRKLLKRALIGPTLTSWYPERIRKLDALFEDPDDRRRKVKLERMKRRGKGPPKKGEGRGRRRSSGSCREPKGREIATTLGKIVFYIRV